MMIAKRNGIASPCLNPRNFKWERYPKAQILWGHYDFPLRFYVTKRCQTKWNIFFQIFLPSRNIWTLFEPPTPESVSTIFGLFLLFFVFLFRYISSKTFWENESLVSCFARLQTKNGCGYSLAQVIWKCNKRMLHSQARTWTMASFDDNFVILWWLEKQN